MHAFYRWMADRPTIRAMLGLYREPKAWVDCESTNNLTASTNNQTSARGRFADLRAI